MWFNLPPIKHEHAADVDETILNFILITNFFGFVSKHWLVYKWSLVRNTYKLHAYWINDTPQAMYALKVFYDCVLYIVELEIETIIFFFKLQLNMFFLIFFWCLLLEFILSYITSSQSVNKKLILDRLALITYWYRY